MRTYLAPTSLGFLILAILLGGASSQGILGNALLQFLAVILIVWVLLCDGPESVSHPKGPRIRWVVAAAILLACAQFVPLPPTLWSQLPGREELATGFDLLGMPLPWQTVSMAPWSTLASLTWCLPAIAMFMVARSPRGPSLATVATVLVTLAVISIALGVEQLITGNLYLYETTNYGTPVGLFANVNHQASFIICALLFWTAHQSLGGAHLSSPGKPLPRVIFYGVSLYFVVGVILCGSVAGSSLLVLAILGSWFCSNSDIRWWPAVLAALLVLSIVSATAYVFAGSAASDIFLDTTQPGMSRADFWRIGFKMLIHYLPFGSGIGTFQELYPLFENPAVVDRTYVNHVHNDYLELLIEAGAFALVLIIVFAVCLARCAVSLFRRDIDFASRACGLAVLVLALHSFVDYPLRTAALSSIFALALGYLARRPVDGGASQKRDRASIRSRVSRRSSRNRDQSGRAAGLSGML